MIPTPNLDHLTKKDYEVVYEPAEDTFILLDALEEETDLLQRLKPRICLEIGSGSGCVSAFIGQILGSSNGLYLCTDINIHASRCSILTGRHNNVALEAITTSLFAPLEKRLEHKVDVLLFNPPYVPTGTEEADDAQVNRGIYGSWAGGSWGMEITNLVLDKLDSALSQNGLFYLVAIKRNNVPAIQERMWKCGFESKIVLQRRAGIENLLVIRFQRSKDFTGVSS